MVAVPIFKHIHSCRCESKTNPPGYPELLDPSEEYSHWKKNWEFSFFFSRKRPRDPIIPVSKPFFEQVVCCSAFFVSH